MASTGSKVYVNVGSIETFNQNIKLKNEEIVSILDDMINVFQLLDEKFNSRAGEKYRERILTYLAESKEKINNSNLVLSNNISQIITIYDNTIASIDRMVS